MCHLYINSFDPCNEDNIAYVPLSFLLRNRVTNAQNSKEMWSITQTAAEPGLLSKQPSFSKLVMKAVVGMDRWIDLLRTAI